MHTGTLTKVLLIEDDEDDYVLTRALLSEIGGQQFTLDWAKTFHTGLEALCRNEHDVALVDYRLGAKNGIDLLREAQEQNCGAPIILLTGSGQHHVDLEAMNAGAADYLVKSQLRADSLERSIRYAIQRRRAAAVAAFEQARLASFGADVGLALTQRDSLEAILQRCANAMTQYLNAAIAQIATYDPKNRTFDPRGFASSLTEVQNVEWGGQNTPRVRLDLESLGRGEAVVIKQLAKDERFTERGWSEKHRLVSYAAYPLVLEDKLVGLMSLFSREPLTEQIQQEMGSVANGISLCIERKRSEEALDASEVKYRSVVENIKEIIFQMDEFGQWTFLNPAWTAVTGFDAQQTLGTFFLEYVHEEDREKNRHIFLQLVQQKLNYCRYETRFLTHNGKIRWVEAYAQVAQAPDGGLLGISGSLTDITERKLAEDAIQKLAAFPRVNPNPVLEFSGDGTLTYANDAARDLARSLGKEDVLSILPPHAPELVRASLSGGQRSLRKEVSVDGHTIAWSFFPVAANQVVHCYGADVTEMLNLEAQLRHAQKLESVGQLAAGVAHDFNNVLTVIQGYTECLIVRCQGDPATSQALKQISDGAKRAAALTRQLLMFSRKQVIQTTMLDLNAVLRNVANMLVRLLGEDIRLETEYGPGLPRIEADTGMLEQVVMNLAVNSRDAMPEGGRLKISTEAVDIDHSYVALHSESRTGQFICLTVEDTGCGIDRGNMERIFEPFFTTKEVGKGTGLGLATVYGIVKQHHGWIDVSSEVGLGTVFKIYFPAVAVLESRAPTATVSSEVVRGGHETILVVEDEPVLRELVCEVLGQYSYRIIQAASGHEALRVWDEFDGEVDLLLTDMVMPEGMSGRELAAQLKKRKPTLKVIYSSGYSPETMGREFNESDTVFLSKPYLPPQLALTVRQCLDGARRRSGEVVSA
jgi:two-component system, cell cycle sensor histidine kinase and response regulator CckA